MVSRFSRFIGDVCVRASFICLPTQETQETRVRSLGQEDPLEKEMATGSSIPAWRIPWPEEPGGLQSRGSQRIGHDGSLMMHLSMHGKVEALPS